MSATARPAYVLHHYDWSETSLILDLFTRDQGRIAVVAKGAKRPYSQLRSVLLPFQRVQAAIGRARHDASDGHDQVQTLRSAEYAGTGAVLAGAALFAGFYLNELLMKLLARHDPHPRLFDAYAATLQALAERGEGGAQPWLRAFELVLLRETGVLPELSCVTSTQQPLDPARPYALRAEVGLEPADAQAAGVPGATWQAAQAALSADDLPALAAACAGSPAALKAQLRDQLRAQLQHHGGSPTLRTRQVLQDVQRLLDSAPQPATR